MKLLDKIKTVIEVLDVRRVRQDPERDTDEEEQEPKPSYAELEKHLKEVVDLLVRTEEKAAFYKRRGDEYFAVVRSFELQRDQWKSLYLNDGRAHQQAQAMLERALEQKHEALRRAVVMVNQYREKAGEAPIKEITQLAGPPVGTAQATAERLMAEQAAVQPQLESRTELERVNAALGTGPDVPASDPEKR
jgi:hypothetical protein